MLTKGCSLVEEAATIHEESILDKLIGLMDLSRELGGRIGQFFKI